MYSIELVWNHGFHFVKFGSSFKNIDDAISYSKKLENMGDGTSVKKTRVIDGNGCVVYVNGRKMANKLK